MRAVGIYLFIFFMTASNLVLAHPVIYGGGKVVSSFNMPSYSDNQLMYSMTSKWASGLNHWRFTKEDRNTELGLARLNHLLYRYNGEDSQANFYLLSGVGIVDAELETKGTREAYMGGFETDWESRTLFVALKHYQFTSPSLFDLGMTQARVGFSPSETPFDQLQTWFMLQAMYMPETDRTVMLTPLLRFFYHNVLWEVGSSTRGEWMANLMVHF